MTRYSKFLACAGIVALALAACQKGEKDERPVLVVSIEPQRQMLEQLAGDDYRIVTLMPNGENPETFEPSPARRIDVENAQAYFTTGNLLFENNLEMTARDKSIFHDMSQGIAPIYGTHTHFHGHSEFLPDDDAHVRGVDPHVWVSVKNARVMAKNMTRVLSEIDKDNAAAYQARLATYDAHLDSLDQAFAARLDSLPNTSFLVWHPSMSYFARDYGLNQIVVGSETKESSVNDLRNVIKAAKNDSV